MNNEDKKYLRATEKTRPSLEVFSKMVEILKAEDEKICQLYTDIDNYLLNNFKIIQS